MECEADLAFHETRCQLRGSTIDSGTEKGMADDTVMIIPKYKGAHLPSDINSYMCPKLLGIPGSLHIIFNSLQAGVTNLTFAKQWLEYLGVLRQFLSNKQLRWIFQYSCLTGTPAFAKFNHYATVHIDWRWEFLSKALCRLLPLYGDLKQYWDEAKVMQGESGMSNMAALKNVTQVLAVPDIEEFGEMLRVQGKTLEHMAHKLEGC